MEKPDKKNYKDYYVEDLEEYCTWAEKKLAEQKKDIAEWRRDYKFAALMANTAIDELAKLTGRNWEDICDDLAKNKISADKVKEIRKRFEEALLNE